MNTIANKNTEATSLTFIERILRVAVGAGLIGSIFTTATVLTWQLILPLIGSYAVVSGITGLSLLGSFLHDQPILYRSFQLVLSAALIGTVFIANTAPLGGLVLLPMVGIYTALAALLGQSPVSAIIDAAKVIPHVVPPSGVVIESNARNVKHVKRRTTATLSHVA